MTAARSRSPATGDDPRRRLLAAAAMILESGRAFTEISVEDLAGEAGLARTTFYEHFADKSALLMELADHVTRVFEDGASRWYRLPAGATRGDLREALRELARTHIDHRFTMSAVVDAAAYDPAIRAAYEAVIEVRIAGMRQSFRDQQRDGAICADIDVENVTPWIAWMTERAPFQLLRRGPDALQSHLEGITTVIWRTLYSGSR